jgi:hypothetical protein
MLTFDKNSNQCIVLMYPTGGYGNFLHFLLSQHFENTVKINNSNFSFSVDGNSHQTVKYVENFLLGSSYQNKDLRNFSYQYKVNSIDAYDQICQGKKFVVLGDTGNLGDNVNFLKKYFPNALIIRTYASTFEEKFVVWANAIKKTNITVYKDSIHPIEGIAKFNNKPVEEITDQDAIDCAFYFFKNDFEKYGKFFNSPVVDDNIINVPIQSFFTQQSLLETMHYLAKSIDTTLVNITMLVQTIENFLQCQRNIWLLDNYNNCDSITAQALKKYYQ